jgi:hypothetical protein
MTLPLGYTSGISPEGPIPRLSSRQFVWSLLGECSKSSRPDAARALSSIEPHFFYSTDRVPGFRFSSARTPGGFAKKEYRQLLLETMFVPSPMGNANIECYRTFEALECGSVPIVERRPTLDYYAELLGTDFPGLSVHSWHEARSKISELIKHPADLDTLQGRCLDWWGAFKNSYSLRVGQFIEERSRARSAPASPIRGMRARLPLWREAELIRHHSLGALVRRISRQAARLVRQRRWRVAFRKRAYFA